MKDTYPFYLIILSSVFSNINAQSIRPFTEVYVGFSVNPWQRMNTDNATLKIPESAVFIESSINIIPLSVGVSYQGLGSYRFAPYTLNQSKAGIYLKYYQSLGQLGNKPFFASVSGQYNMIWAGLNADSDSGIPNNSLGSITQKGFGYDVRVGVGTYFGCVKTEVNFNYAQNFKPSYVIGDFVERPLDINTQSVQISFSVPLTFGAQPLPCPIF